MRQLGPSIERKFRFLLQRFGVLVPRRWNLDRILKLLQRIRCLIECHGQIYTDEIQLTTSLSHIRGADLMAKRTKVTNSGNTDAIIYEQGNVVAIVPPGETRELALSGRFIIEGKCESGTISIEITTYRRCTCGDVYYPHPGEAIEPIGGDLI